MLKTYKQIERSREIRLWIGQVIVPAVTTVGTMMLIPEVRYAVGGAVTNAKNKIKQTLGKMGRA